MSGRQKDIEKEEVGRIARALSPEPSIQAELIRAHLLDNMPEGRAADLIYLEIHGKGSKLLDKANRTVKLAPDVEKALDHIRQRIPHDEDMREMILRLGKFAKPGDAT